jgi:hypothetical protein
MDPNIIALLEQAPFGVAVVHLLQWLKATERFPWITADTDKLNRRISFAVAFLMSLGFMVALQGSAQTGGTLTITLPPIGALWSAVGRALAQSGLQQVYYHVAVKGTAPAKA